MKIIKPSVELITDICWRDVFQTIEKAGRVCYKSEDKITDDGDQDLSATKFIKSLINRGHEAMIEHYNITVKVICDRGISHEIVRHRIASYAQESTRYCNYSKDKFGNELTFIKPCFWETTDPEYHKWKWCMETLERKYLEFIEMGATPQEARSILPNSLKTEIIITMNLREWRHFFKLRCDKDAHPQMREVANMILYEFKDLLPVIFEDIQEETR